MQATPFRFVAVKNKSKMLKISCGLNTFALLCDYFLEVV